MAQKEDTLSQDLIFEILSSARRRYVLYYLRQVDGGPVELTKLAKQVAAWENETTVDDLTKQQEKRVYVSLYQSHIPKLDSAGIVEYDRDEGVVSLDEDAFIIDEYLDDGADTFPWQYLYLSLAVVSIPLLALSAFDVLVFAGVPVSALAFSMVIAFLLAALAHYLAKQRRREHVPEELERRR